MKAIFLKQLAVGLALFATVACGQNGTMPTNITASDANVISSPTSEKQTNSSIVSGGPRRVMYESPDKVIIVGSFYAVTKPDSPAVLLLHQFGSNRQSYDEFAKRLQAKGFGVLAIDGRGFGESVMAADGKAVSVSRSDDAVKGMLDDVGAAFEFLSKQKNVDPARIGIVGASYGSSLAMIYGSDNPKVKSVALLSPGLSYFGNMPTEPAIKKYGDRALLMIAADDDKESADSVRKLKEAGANAKYEIQIYPKGGHGTGLFRAKVGLEDLLEQFLIKSL